MTTGEMTVKSDPEPRAADVRRIHLTPLLGAHDEGPLSYLLVIDSFTILLDCGWDDRLQLETIQPILERVGQIDAVLLSHSDTSHLGALPYLVGKAGLKVPVYATLPVQKMGHMYMYDHYLGRQSGEDNILFTLDDVDVAFGAVHSLKYSQGAHLAVRVLNGFGRATGAVVAIRRAAKDGGGGGPSGITVTPYAAGHLLGGTLWKISKDTEDVLYAVDFNHKKERHLNGTVLEQFNRPSLLITDAYTAARTGPSAKERDLADSVMKVLRNDGNVLLPIDTAGRVLELVLHFEQLWGAHKLNAYHLVLYNNVAFNTVEFAKSHLEWMNDAITNTFDTHRTNAFSTRFLHYCHSREQLTALGPKPKLVMASMGSLEVGPARDLFVSWAANPRNLVLFTDMGQPGTLARQTMELVRAAPQSDSVKRIHPAAMQVAPTSPVSISLQLRERVALAGDELRAFEEKRAADEAEAAAARVAAAVAVPSSTGWASAGDQAAAESGPFATPAKGPAARAAAATAAVAGSGTGAGGIAGGAAESTGMGGVGEVSVSVRAEANARGPWNCLCEGFVADEAAAGPMFPFEAEQEHWDAYGEALTARDLAALDAINEAEEDAMEVDRKGTATGDDAVEGEGANAIIPTKIVESTATVTVNCALLYLDFEGRSDARSIKMILQHMAPLQVALVHGSKMATESLAEHCRKALAPAPVHAPARGVTVDCSAASAAYKVRLTEELMATVKFKAVDSEYEVAWVDGVLGAAPRGSKVIPLLPRPEDTELPHKAALVGTLKLSDFKQTLAAAGVPAEFSGGVLLCGGNVTVRKDAVTQQLVLEGALSEDYYKIRGILYSQFHIL